jgi:hypothetical protein
MEEALMIRRRVIAVAASGALMLSATAVALAARPTAGKKYSGFTSAHKVSGFGAPVSFKVSSSGGPLLQFTYSTLGCLGSGGLGKGNPFKGKFAVMKIGTIAVSGSGSFSAPGRKSTYTSHGFTTTTTSSVSGKFPTANKATGSITFGQKVTGKGTHQSCGPERVTFTAKTK